MTNRTISPLRQRMVEDMNARQLGPHSQRSHIYSCERFASFLKRSPDTAAADDVRKSRSDESLDAGEGIAIGFPSITARRQIRVLPADPASVGCRE